MRKIELASLAVACFLALNPAVSAGEQGRTVKSPPSGEASPDRMFDQPYVDVDEWRDAPTRHRYVHGGFRGTDTRFSFYFPPASQYQGRFFQHFTPAPDNENLAQKVPMGEASKIGFALSSGGYFVETNGGGRANSGGPGQPADPTIGAYRANAAAARYSRLVAHSIYGGGRPFGYAYGGSGGAYRTVGSFENTRGVWDGVVPYVLGSPMASPSNFTVRMHAMRIVAEKFAQVDDAVDVGGSGNPYADLNPEQAAALREVTRMGFPIGSWFGWRTMGVHAFPAIYGGILAVDPTYFSDFWTKPGYLGHDHPEQLTPYRMQFSARIAKPLTNADAVAMKLNTSIVNGTADGGVDNAFGTLQAGQKIVAFRLDATPPAISFMGGDIMIRSGLAQGRRLAVSAIRDDIVVLGVADPATSAMIAPGDELVVDNSNYLAAQTYHRHQVPGPEYPGWNQFRGLDGKPIYPQRPMLLGPLFTKGAAGSIPTGKWEGKMILVESLLDREAWPWQAAWYRAQVEKNFGASMGDHFRLWYTDHGLHGDNSRQEDPTRSVGYIGVLHQALRDLAAWVERGITPPPSTAFTISDDTRITLPATARERRGIQPVIMLSADGSGRVTAKTGQAVRLSGTITVPPGAGSVIAAAWDLDGSGAFATSSPVPADASRAKVMAEAIFSRPGIYFVTLKGTSQRDGDRSTPFARIDNIGRIRIIVTD